MKRIAISHTAAPDTDNINKQVKDALAFIDALFKKKGWKRKRKTQSATYQIDYEAPATAPGSRGPEVYSLSGWHGSGSYGAGSSIFSLYHDSKKPGDGFKVVVDMKDGPMPGGLTAQTQADTIKKIKDALQAAKI